MKSFFRKFLVALSLLTIVTTVQGEALEKAPPNVKLLGNADGLVHIPEDDLFLFYPNMLPGDKVTRVLEIKNKYDHPYELFIRAERVSPMEEFDLLDKINLKITYKDNIIYDGKVSGEYEMTDDISLGVFQPGQEEDLVAVAELDGKTTGNEYKNKSVQVDWIFTAIRAEETPDSTDDIEDKEDKVEDEIYEDTPKTGDISISKYVLLLGAALGLFIFISKRKKEGY